MEREIRLNLNENYGIFNEKILNEIKKFNFSNISLYPKEDKLIDELSKYTRQPKKNIMVTNGADQAIDLVIRGNLNKNDKVVVPAPTFYMYNKILALVKASVKYIPYKDLETKFEFPFREVLKSIKGAKALILCNPNNPLGTTIKKEEMITLIELMDKQGGYCIIDEAYFGFYNKTYSSLLKKYNRLIIIRSFSKWFGLAGVRLGYVLSNEKIIKSLLNIKGVFDVNRFALHCGLVVLKNREYFKKRRKVFLKSKKEILTFFKKNNIQMYKSKANFIVIKLKNKKKFIKKLRKKRILVKSIEEYPISFGLLKDSIRISIPQIKDIKFFKSVFIQSLNELNKRGENE